MDELEDAAFKTLTPREIACLRLVGQHMLTKEIARELDLAPNTVNTYIKSACGRLGAKSRREAAARLIKFEASAPATLPEPTPIAQPVDQPPEPRKRHPLLRPIIALQHPGPKTEIFIKTVAYLSFALAAFMAVEAVIVAVHNAMNPAFDGNGGHRIQDAAHGRQSLSNILLTGRPSVRFFLAFCFFGPALALLKGGAALRIAALTMVTLVLANVWARFSPMTVTVVDALQLAVYLGLLKLTRQVWARLVVTLQLAIVVADVAFHIQGIIDRRTWDAVQLFGMFAMAVVVIWAVLARSRSKSPEPAPV